MLGGSPALVSETGRALSDFGFQLQGLTAVAAGAAPVLDIFRPS